MLNEERKKTKNNIKHTNFEKMRFNEKAIIFDMDGTLVDNIRYHEESWLIFLKEHGIDMEPANFAAQNHGTMDEMIIRFFGEDVSGDRVQELGLKKEETYQSLYQKHIREVNGLTPFLQKLVKRILRQALRRWEFLQASILF